MSLPTYITGPLQTRAYGALRENVFRVLSKYDINPSQWFMIGFIIEAKDGIRQVDVAKQMGVKPPLITVMVKELEKRKLITTIQSQFDSRTKLIGITPEGKKLVKGVESELHDHLLKLLSGLTESDMIIYHKVLSTIVANDITLKRTEKIK